MTFERDPWTCRKKTCDLSPGRRLAYVERESEGPLALLIHGFTDSSRSFSLLEPLLKGFSLIIPDLAGHGHSAAPEAGYDIDSLAQDIVSLMKQLGRTPDAIVGHSLGALIAIRLASGEYRKADRLVLLSGSLRPSLGDYGPLSEWISAISDPIDPEAPFFDDWYEGSRDVPANHVHRLRTEAASVRAEVWRNVFRTLETCDLTDEAMRLSIPAMIIAGVEDKLFDSRHREVLRRALPAAKHLLLDGVGHNPHWDKPEEVGRLISLFVTGNP